MEEDLVLTKYGMGVIGYIDLIVYKKMFYLSFLLLWWQILEHEIFENKLFKYKKIWIQYIATYHWELANVNTRFDHVFNNL
jgi:hypothetical protein